MNFSEILGSIVNLVKKGWNSFGEDTQKVILGCIVLAAGGLLPWGRLGEAGGYIQFGLIAAGILTASMGIKKPGEKSFLSKLGLDGLFGKKEEKKVSDKYCSKCGRRMKTKEDYCSNCGRTRRT